MAEVAAPEQTAEVLSATGQVLVPLKKTRAKPKGLAKIPTGRQADADERADRIEQVERELYERNLRVLLDASYFGDVDPAAMTSAPQPWVEELGAKEASRRFVIAKAAMLAPKEAPSGLGVAKHIVSAFAKAKAQAQAPRSLNVTLISMVSGPKLLPSIELEEESR